MKQYFSKDRKRNNQETNINPESPMELARPIWLMINGACSSVAGTYKTVLSQKSVAYISAAVWGDQDDGPLDEVQNAIFAQVNLVVNDVMDIMALEGLDESRKFTVEFLVRGLIISRIGFAIESYRLWTSRIPCVDRSEVEKLMDMPVVGRA